MVGNSVCSVMNVPGCSVCRLSCLMCGMCSVKWSVSWHRVVECVVAFQCSGWNSVAQILRNVKFLSSFWSADSLPSNFGDKCHPHLELFLKVFGVCSS
jgi:hypothetical protein